MGKQKRQPARSSVRFDLAFCRWGSKTMTSGTQNKTQGGLAPGRRIASGLACAALCLLVLWPPSSFAAPRGWGRQRAQAARAAPVRPAPAQRQAGKAAGNQKENGKGNGAGQAAGSTVPRPAFGGNPAAIRPGVNGGERPGQQHLPEWLNQHQNLSPQQQEDLLRREPGFNRLSPDQQQRVLNRLRTLDARPPEQRQRMAQRGEMWERLSPGQQQDVRDSFQAWNQMAPDRRRMVGRAFSDLRQIPPEQRTEILNSARFSQTFTPQERHVLGSLLSVEPYEPR